MKWVGWFLFAIALVLLAFAHERGTREIATEKARVAAELESRKHTVDETFGQAEESMRTLERRLEQEKAKTAELRLAVQELETRHTAVQERVAELSRAIESLQETAGSAQDTRRDRLAEVAESQRTIARLEREIELLRKHVATVTPISGI